LKPLPDQDPKRRAKELAEDVTRQIPEDGPLSWVVLDGFDAPGVSEFTHVFIDGLAAAARNHPALRLALLGYTRRLGERAEPAVRRTAIEYITWSDLIDYLNALRGRP